MNQLTIFDSVRFPRAHRNDPSSSHAAAAAGEASGRFKTNAMLVLSLVKRFPQATAAELAYLDSDHNLDKHEIRRRLTELVQAGMVEQIKPTEAMKPCDVAGKKACRYLAR
jgi:predicted HTH transcriptional regulator